MKLEDLDRDIHGVVAAPVLRSEPEEEWVRARETGTIPESLFSFYCRASYFSWDAIPPYLKDPDSILYHFLEALIDGIKDSLEDAKRLIPEIEEATARIYSPLAEIRGDEVDDRAPKRQIDAFKWLVVSLTSALDLLAEVTALLLGDEVRGISFGRASFSDVYRFLKSDSPPTGGVVTPARHFAIEYHKRLRPLLVRDGTPEQEWLDLLHLYRNKLAHLGRHQINQMVLPDYEGRSWYFLPRIWPFQWKQYIMEGESSRVDDQSMEEWMNKTFLQIDIIEYSEGIVERVFEAISIAFEILGQAYSDFAGFAFNERALEDLRRNSRKPAFRFFED